MDAVVRSNANNGSDIRAFLNRKIDATDQQGDVTVLPLAQTVGVTVLQELRKKLIHLTLAKGGVTANKFPIGEQGAELYTKTAPYCLRVL